MTSTEKSIQVWNSNDGWLLVDIKVPASSPLWCKNHFVLTRGSTIKQIDAATRSTISELSIPSAWWPQIALPQHRKFIVYSAEKTSTFWDTMIHSQLSFIQHTHGISSIAWSPDGQLLVIASGRQITVKTYLLSYPVWSWCVHVLSSIHFLHLSSRSQNLILIALHSMHGNVINSQMQKH